MSTFGERLRHARESQGLTLAQASMETRILQKSLDALEQGDFHLLPNDVVVKGFVRNYSQFLGLPPEEMIDLYRRERNNLSTKIQVVPATRIIPQRSYIFPNFFGVFFVTIALIGLTYTILNATGYLGSASQIEGEQAVVVEAVATPTPLATVPALTSQTEPSPSPQMGTPVALAPLVAPRTPSIVPGRQPAGFEVPAPTTTAPALSPSVSHPTASVSPESEAPIVVDVAVEPGEVRSWLRITVDERVVYEGIMQPGEGEVFQVNRRIEIRAGNPPAVNVGVNGAPPEPLGTVPGQPINWTWPPM